MYLQGVEVVAKISGSAAKHIAAFLYAVMKDKNQTQGKTKLKNMLKSNSKLKVFSIRQKDLAKFSKEAKRYGVLYCLLTSRVGKKDPNKMVDIMVREEDATRIDRIVQKFHLSTYEKASVKSEVQRDKEKENSVGKEENSISNPQKAMTEKDPLSEPFCENKINSGVASNQKKKPSVRQALKEIKNELKMRNEHEEIKKDIRKGKDTNTRNKNNNLSVRKGTLRKGRTR